MKKWFTILSFAFLFYDPTKNMVGLQEVGHFFHPNECEQNRLLLEREFKKKFSSAGNWWISPACHRTWRK